MDVETPILYYYPSSYYSQKALLAVAQKGVKVRYRIVNLPEREAYAPWCMRLNPTGQLPFMEHGGAIIPDSKAITEYLDKTFEGPSLFTDTSTELGRKVKEAIALIDSMTIPVLTYGSGWTPELTSNVQLPWYVVSMMKGAVTDNTLRKTLERFYSEVTDPALKAVYETKMAAPPPFPTDIPVLKAGVRQALEEAGVVFDKLEKQLAQSKKANPDKATWLLGDDFTAADIALVVALERLTWIGFAERLWGSRPLISQYRERLMSEKPNYVALCTKINPKDILAKKIWGQVAKYSPWILGMSAIALGIWYYK